MQAPRHRLERRHGGAVWHLEIASAPGNVLDTALCAELVEAVREVEAEPKARLLILEGAGPNFSFGASVAEHRAEAAPQMLRAMRELLLTVHGSPVPVLALVRGYCLGGGLELALCCSWIAAAEDARFGLPEITLGALPAFALALLPGRVAPAVAEDWMLSGRHFSAAEAEAAGLVRVALPGAELESWLTSFLAREVLPRSAPVLRLLRTAFREERQCALAQAFAREEQRYLEALLPLADASEGVEAFLARREPRFRHA
jgi:cyclohexa-1,5-dienecarbonyl-CoA hydratase